ncbi:MAG: PEP-CTERM sorting domain-containing protein [Armatimonadota bacterium]
MLNYDTRKWDFYVNGSLFASNLGFYHTAYTAANNIRFYKGTNNLGMAVDNLQIIPEPSSMLVLASGILGPVGCIRRRG